MSTSAARLADFVPRVSRQRIHLAMLCALGAAMLGWLTPQVAQADPITVTSSNFSIGYGFFAFAWRTDETSGANTPTTIGNFQFTPTVTGTIDSGAGPQFPNRVLTDASSGHSGQQADFAVSITGQYTGSLSLPYIDPVTPNLRVQMNITQISIYAVGYDGYPPSTTQSLNFVETTSGHGSSSPTVILPPISLTPGWNLAASYQHIVWDPSDFVTSGMSQTRSFNLAAGAGTDPGLDGFEVFGTVSLIYDTIPEPTSLSLIAGLGAMLALRRSRARRVSSST